MESLTQNKPLLWSVVCSISAVVALVTGWFPDLANQFSIVEFPLEVCSLFCAISSESNLLSFPFQYQKIVLGVLAMDLALAFIIDRTLDFLFGKAKLRTV